MNRINKLIKEKRIEKGLTQQELANAIGITRNYISDIENGRYTPSLKTTIKLASYLDLNLNLLSGMSEIQDKTNWGLGNRGRVAYYFSYIYLEV